MKKLILCALIAYYASLAAAAEPLVLDKVLLAARDRNPEILAARQAWEVMKAALRSAQARLGSNQTSASDVFMAQGELRRMENELFQQQQQRALIAIELNTLLNQPTDTPLGPAQAPELADLPLSLPD